MNRAFDSWRSLSLSLYMVLTGYAVLVGMPVLSTAWVTKLGFTEVEVGRLAAADIGGLSCGAVLCAFVIARTNRRYLCLGATLVAVLANLACAYTTEYQPMLALRLTAGIASGVYTALAVVSLGARSNPARAYSWALFAFAFSQALELYLLPQLSMSAVYLLLACAYSLTLPFLRWMPSHASDPGTPARVDAETPPAESQDMPVYLPWLVLAAILLSYVNIGAYWTYIELASLDAGASPEWVGAVLVFSSLFSIGGCLVATLISGRFGLARPLVVTLLSQAAVVVMLAGGINDTNIVVSVCGFNFLWMFSDIFQLSTVAKVDPSGRFAALVPGAQGVGQIIGPNLAAALLATELAYSGVFVMCALASLGATAIYLGLYVQKRQVIPTFAGASHHPLPPQAA